jgi:outer membrane immunogenic protein
MLRTSVTARAIAPNEETRPRGLFKPLMVFSILALAGAVSVVSAHAADIFDRGFDGSHGPGDFLETGIFNWSGLYFGGHVGGAWGDVDLNVVESPFFEPSDPSFAAGDPTALVSGDKVSTDLDGVVAGTHIGFNQQVGRFVFGVEGSFSGADLNGSTTLLDEAVVGGVVTARDIVTLETEMDWLALATLRLGFTRDRWLLYLKGGYATGDVSIRGGEQFLNSPPPPLTLVQTRHFDSGERHHGWHIGAGLEYALPTTSCCNNVIFGLEYNFIDLDSERHTGTAVRFDEPEGAELPPGRRFDIDVDPDGIHVVKVRLSYKFGCCDVAALPPLK